MSKSLKRLAVLVVVGVAASAAALVAFAPSEAAQ